MDKKRQDLFLVNRTNKFCGELMLFEFAPQVVEGIIFALDDELCESVLEIYIFAPRGDDQFHADAPTHLVALVVDHHAEVGVDRCPQGFKQGEPPLLIGGCSLGIELHDSLNEFAASAVCNVDAARLQHGADHLGALCVVLKIYLVRVQGNQQFIFEVLLHFGDELPTLFEGMDERSPVVDEQEKFRVLFDEHHPIHKLSALEVGPQLRW